MKNSNSKNQLFYNFRILLLKYFLKKTVHSIPFTQIFLQKDSSFDSFYSNISLKKHSSLLTRGHVANRSPANRGEASRKEGGVDFHFDVLIAPCRVRQTQEKKRKLIRLLHDLRIPLLHHPLSRYPDFTCKTQCRSPRKPQFRLT